MAHPRTLGGLVGAAGRLRGLCHGLYRQEPLAALLWLRARLLEERERWLLWFPVGLGTGIALYFALPSEPPAWPARAALFATLCLVAWTWWRARAEGTPWFLPWLMALLAILLGLTVAQFRTERVAAPSIAREGVRMVEGRVILVEDREQGHRLLIERPAIERIAPEATPERVRITVRSGAEDIRPGDRVRVLAMLLPPSGPSLPGAFDYARQAFFERLGAVGFAYGAPERLEAAAGGGLALRIARLRQSVALAVTLAVPGPTGAVATALLTGLRAAIPDHIWQDMQIAGLAHLLAISGLHLGLVAGTVFLAVRYAFLLIPPLALRWPVKKIAAATALIAAFCYMLLAGAPIPSQRAFLMAGVALVGIMADRNPFSMRLVAGAAVLVLLLQPESLLGASFQMSFAAVVGLIAVYEVQRARLARSRDDGHARRLWLYVQGVALTTLVASTATAPLAAFHFQRIATFGIVANLIAVPVTAFWIMPAGLTGLLLMPLGWSAPAFVVMGMGIDVVLASAAGAARLPMASIDVAQWTTSSLVAFALGGLWLTLWRGPWRRLGLFALPLGLALALAARPPDLIASAKGDLVAVRQDDGRLALSPWRRDSYTSDDWLRRGGRREAAPWPGPGTASGPLRCDELGCVLDRDGHRIAVIRRSLALAEDCRRADLVVSLVYGSSCPGPVAFLGPRELSAAEGAALWLEPRGVRVETVRARRGDRPWTR